MSKGTSKAPSQRQLRVGEEIRHALATIFERGELRDPALQNVSVTVTEVRVSPDLKKATAFVLPLGGTQTQAREVVDALTHAQKFLRHHVANLIQLRYAPEIHFSVDQTYDQVDRIDRLLHESRSTIESTTPDEEDHGA